MLEGRKGKLKKRVELYYIHKTKEKKTLQSTIKSTSYVDLIFCIK